MITARSIIKWLESVTSFEELREAHNGTYGLSFEMNYLFLSLTYFIKLNNI